jgi:hypothetical protein
MEFQSVSPVILPRDHSMLTGRRSQCRKTAASFDGGAAMTPKAAFHTAGFCASTGTRNPSGGAIQESVQGLNIFAGRSRECSSTAVSAILVNHDRGSAGLR